MLFPRSRLGSILDSPGALKVKRQLKQSVRCKWRRQDYAKKRGEYYARMAAYRAKKTNRLPIWADRTKIQNIYVSAERQGLSVDHIVPLRGMYVCGLHVENNLQIIPLADNMAKHASHETWL